MSWLNTITNALSIAAAAQDGNRSSSGGFPDLTLLVPIPQGDSLPARELVSEIVKRVFAAHGIHATDTELRQATGKLTPTLDFNGTRAGNFASVGDHPVHGGGKVHGYRFTITDELQRQVLAHAPAQNGTATSARETSRGGEVAMYGSQMRHKLEMQMRKQEALQQAAQSVAESTGLAGAVTLTAQRTPNAIKDLAAQLPKAAPLVGELLPPIVATGIVAGGVALGLDKQLELMVERQMEMVKSAPPPIATSNTADDAPPVTTAERPAQPEIKVVPEGGELVKPNDAPPVTGKPETPLGQQPSIPPPPSPSGKPPTGGIVEKAVPLITGAATGAAIDEAMQSSPFDAAITAALNSDNPGEVLEGKVATYVKPDLVAFQKKIGANGELGEIDVETDVAIIEVTTASKKKLDQIEKYLNNSTFNPNNKPVILYAPKYNRFAEQSIMNAGAYVARSKEELLELLDKLKQQ